MIIGICVGVLVVVIVIVIVWRVRKCQKIKNNDDERRSSSIYILSDEEIAERL